MSEPRPALARRRFIQLLAASGAAVAAGAAPRVRAATPPKAVKHGAPARASLPPHARLELRKQEKNVADMLQIIRSYELPPGSDPAITFQAMRSARKYRR
jgi:hypothetical protein